MSVIQKLEAFKWRNLPEDTTKLPTANEDDEPARPLSFDDLAARVRITRNDVVLAVGLQTASGGLSDCITSNDGADR